MLIFECQGDLPKQQTVFTEVENKEDNIVFKKIIMMLLFKILQLNIYYHLQNVLICQSLEIYIDNKYPLLFII